MSIATNSIPPPPPCYVPELIGRHLNLNNQSFPLSNSLFNPIPFSLCEVTKPWKWIKVHLKSY